MFTIDNINDAHSKVKSGADFPRFMQDIKALGVLSFEIWVADNHSVYYGNDGYEISSEPLYDNLHIEDSCDSAQFKQYLLIHQKGETDYFTFCQHCAATGIEKWIVSIPEMTCIYYDKAGNEILKEQIKSL